MEASFKRLPQNIFKESNEARNRWRHRFDTPEKYDHMLKNYFRLITGVDTACKAVWDELEKQGILDETMFIFTTDNGFVSIFCSMDDVGAAGNPLTLYVF